MCRTLMLPSCVFPYSSLSEVKQNQKTLDTFSQRTWLRNSCTELLWRPETWRFWSRSLFMRLQVFFVQCMFTWVFSLLLFSSCLIPPAWIRGRRKEPPSVEVHRAPPPSLASPLCWWLDSGGLVTREGKKQTRREGKKSFDLFYLTVSSWIQEL